MQGEQPAPQHQNQGANYRLQEEPSRHVTTNHYWGLRGEGGKLPLPVSSHGGEPDLGREHHRAAASAQER